MTARASSCGAHSRREPCTEPLRSRRSSRRRSPLGAGGDGEILNFALTLEYLESDFYNVKGRQIHLSRSGAVSGEAVRRRGGRARQRAERGRAGPSAATPVAKPTFVFPATDEARSWQLASVLENTGVGAYNGAAPVAEEQGSAAAAGSIVQIEARHAAAIDLLLGQSPTPSGGFRRSADEGRGARKGRPLIKS